MFIVITPFVNAHSSIYLLHIMSCFSLLTHWFANNDMCSLSLLEGKLRGTTYNDNNSFTHSLISPIYKISETQWSFTCKILVIILISISLNKISQTENFKLFVKCFKEKYGILNKIKCISILFDHDI